MNIPIPEYPPFTLRSSLVDKDPVIWAHLLEAYHRLCAALLAGDAVLDVKSQQQLQRFVKVYLAETAAEPRRVFSLGAVSPEIRAAAATLRAYVFRLVCDFGPLRLLLGGESLWHFAAVYAARNATLVRGVIAGTHRSKHNDNKKSGAVSSAPAVRKHLMAALARGSLDAADLATLAALLGRQTRGTGRGGTPLARDGRRPAAAGAAFAEHFVTADWLEDLESLHAATADTARDWMVVSVLALPPQKMAAVFTAMGISSVAAMAVAPLLCAVVSSDAYKAAVPGLEERLPFLREQPTPQDSPEPHGRASPEDVLFLTEMFPKLHSEKARYFLQQYGDVEAVAGALLADDSLIDAVPEPPQEPVQVSASELARGLDRFKLGANETNQPLQKEPVAGASKEKTLTAALRLLYESDEDERDDTYDDSEQTTSLGNGPERPPAHDPNELVLFGYLKKGGDAVFEKTARKTPQRAQMKAATKWSDEQIEGWSRMLRRSSRRFRLLEEQYVLVNSNRPRKVPEAEREPRRDNTEREPNQHREPQGPKEPKELKEPKEPKESKAPRAEPKTDPKTKKESDKKAFQKKEANKAKSANHNRKSGHGKKMKSELAGMS